MSRKRPLTHIDESMTNRRMYERHWCGRVRWRAPYEGGELGTKGAPTVWLRVRGVCGVLVQHDTCRPGRSGRVPENSEMDAEHGRSLLGWWVGFSAGGVDRGAGTGL